MRKLTDHIVYGDSCNHQLDINVLDEPGQGGACHHYEVSYPGGVTLDENGKNAIGTISRSIQFQNGPIKENGINGLTQEALLAIVIDRLRSFQEGPFRCRENAIALTHCEDALMWLQRRTRDRLMRGVEGTNIK